MKTAEIVMVAAGFTAVAGSVLYSNITGNCAMCRLAGLVVQDGVARKATGSEQQPAAQPFRQIRRPGSVDIEQEYNLTGLRVPRDEIHTLLPRDAIPSLTDPHRQPIEEAGWLPEAGRIVVVRMKDEVLGVPLAVLDWHEVVNTTVGGEPVAVTYCPLCDSATVFRRSVDSRAADGTETRVVLEFGVSGSLYNSNVLMYDRSDRGLWSQLGMVAVSGPRSGERLEMLPVEVITVGQFKADFPQAQVVSNQTGHEREYGRSPYESYFADEGLMVPVRSVGEQLPRKTLGIGVASGDQAWFIPQSLCKDGFTLDTDLGAIEVISDGIGLRVITSPDGVRTAQSFYYSWSAFYPQTIVVKAPGGAD